MSTAHSPASSDRAHLRELAKRVGDQLREERRAADRSLAPELAASEADFHRLTKDNT